MLVQLRDRNLLDSAYDDLDNAISPASTWAADDEQDLGFVTRNLERDFGYDGRCQHEHDWLRAEAALRFRHATETPAEQKARRLAHARWLLAIAAERNGIDDR